MSRTFCHYGNLSIIERMTFPLFLQWLEEEHERMPEKDPMSAPYHYGCHYSNSGTVLHFLVRLPPFTKMFLQYQGTYHVGLVRISVFRRCAAGQQFDLKKR